jgi:hypothetical protein
VKTLLHVSATVHSHTQRAPIEKDMVPETCRSILVIETTVQVVGNKPVCVYQLHGRCIILNFTGIKTYPTCSDSITFKKGVTSKSIPPQKVHIHIYKTYAILYWNLVIIVNYNMCHILEVLLLHCLVLCNSSEQNVNIIFINCLFINIYK